MRDFRQGLHGVESEARGLFRDALDEPAAAPTTPTQPDFSAATTTAPSPAPHFVISPEPAPQPNPENAPHMVISPDSQSATAD
jgi:hypothetical protein